MRGLTGGEANDVRVLKAHGGCCAARLLWGSWRVVTVTTGRLVQSSGELQRECGPSELDGPSEKMPSMTPHHINWETEAQRRGLAQGSRVTGGSAGGGSWQEGGSKLRLVGNRGLREGGSKVVVKTF